MSFAADAEGRLFHDGRFIGTITLKQETINGPEFVVNGVSVETEPKGTSAYGAFLSARSIAAGCNTRMTESELAKVEAR